MLWTVEQCCHRIGHSHLRVGADREGLTNSLPAANLGSGLGARSGHPEIEAVTVVVLAAGSARIGLQSLDRFVSQHGALGQNAVRRKEDSRSSEGLQV